MPKYNQRGDILFGRDKYVGLIKRNEAPLILGDNCNLPCFISDDKVGCQGNAFSGETYLRTFNPDSSSAPASIVALTGGNDKWAYSDNVDLLLSDGSLRKGKGKASYGNDGTLIYSEFQGSKGLTVEYHDGKTHYWPDILVNETFCSSFIDYVAFNATNKVWYCIGISSAREKTLPSVAIRGTIAVIDGQPWLVYSGPDGTYIVNLINPLVEPKYYKTGTKQYNPDVYFSNGQIYLTYSLTAGERVGDIKEVDITDWFNTGEVPEPIPEPIEIHPIKAFNRRMIFAPYKSFEPKYGISEDFIGNCAFVESFEAANIALSKGLPLICTTDSYRKEYDNPILCLYCHASGSGLDSVKDDYLKALSLSEKPIILYLDSRDWPSVLPNWVNLDRTWIGFQVYRGYDKDTKEVESFEDFEYSIENSLNVVQNYYLPIVLTTQCYDMNGVMNLEQVLEIQPTIESIISADALVIGEMPFSDMRPGGFNFYLDIKDFVRARFNAVFERPNRYDYWKPKDWKGALRELMNYSTLSLLQWQKDYLKSIIK